MKRLFPLVALLALVSCAQDSSDTVEKSSEIPAKREFPIDGSVNPCDDFYAYSCNKVISSFKLREDRSRHAFSFSDSNERLLEYKKNYLARLSDLRPRNKYETEIKEYYLGCMNEDARVDEEKKKVKEELQYVSWATKKIILKEMARNIVTNKASLLYFGKITNLKNPDYYDIYLDINTQTLPERSYYKNKKLMKEFTKLVEDFFVTIGKENVSKKWAKYIIDFETKIAMVYPTPTDFRVLVNKPSKVSRKRLKRDYGHLYFTYALNKLPSKNLIRDFMPETFRLMNKELRNAKEDKVKAIYLYYALNGILDDAYPEYFKKNFDFNHKFLGGAAKRSERDERCTKQIMKKFAKEIDYILMPELFPDFPKKKFIRLAEKVRYSLLKSVKKNKWLTPDAKASAILKIEDAKLQLVSPNNNEEWDFNLIGEYSRKTPIKNYMEYANKRIEKSLEELTKKVSRIAWAMGPLTVNAYYSPSKNKFVMPVGILQYPFYDPSLPDEINLGAVGTVIGHELGHGIDDKGSKYNYKGELNPWMSKKDIKNFQKRSKKLIAQFDKIGHNGTFTLGENIGDLVGVRTAYEAAFNTPKTRANHALQRKFFLQWGRLWCEVQRPKMKEKRLKTDPHSMGFARVNEQMKQRPEFAKAYNCKPGDKMVLPKKDLVKIW